MKEETLRCPKCWREYRPCDVVDNFCINNDCYEFFLVEGIYAHPGFFQHKIGLVPNTPLLAN